MLKTIADKHGRTPAQVALRYQLQRGVVALAKSFHEKRMRENLQVGSRAAGSRGRQGRARALGWARPSACVRVSGAKRTRALCLTRPPSACCGEGPGVDRAVNQGPAGVSVARVSRPLIPSAAR